MAIVVSGISLPMEEPSQTAEDQARALVKGERVTASYLIKKAVDARRKSDIRFVYTVGLELEGEEAAVAARLNRANVTVRPSIDLELPRGTDKLTSPPVVVGFGPAGMFAGLLLARMGLCPIILERGADVDTRAVQVEGFWSTGSLNSQSNVQFGEGGAGTFSDGKLVTRIGDSRCHFVLEQMVAHGAPAEILYQAKPHVGTDKLRNLVKSIRQEIIRLGGKVHFNTQLTGLVTTGGQLTGVDTTAGQLATQALVLAVGHSARDTFQTLWQQGVPMEPKSFSVGVRIEHLQSSIDRALYGDKAGHPLLPKGEYQLSHREGGRAVYTFCMCPGGVVVPAASEEGMVVTNGMSQYARDGVNANSAVVVSVNPADFGTGPLDGVEFQRRLETAAYLGGGGGYTAPAQTVGRFLAGTPGLALGSVEPSYARGIREASFDDLLSDHTVDLLRTGLRRFGRKMPGFDAPDALLTGLETRTSSPLRIPRGDNLESVGLAGLYPCGEGAGYAGGIVSAAVDGVRAAQAILAHYQE